MFSIRTAVEADIPAIHTIYSHYVNHTISTFEETPPVMEEMYKRWRNVVDVELPYLVAADVEGNIIGFAYAGPYRVRSAYRFTVEDSVYITPDSIGKGVGSALLSATVEQVGVLGYKQLLAVVAGGHENHASVALHKKHGFEDVGLLKEVGFKFNRWVDTLLMQRTL